MAKGKNARRKAAQAQRSEREEFLDIMLGALRAATVYQQDAAKALALMCKHMQRRPDPAEEDYLMSEFRKIEQGEVKPEYQKARFKGKGQKRKR